MNVLEIILGAKKALEELGAKKEPGAVLTWDGDTSNAIDIGGQLMVKVHNKYMDLHGIASITIKGKETTVEHTEMPDLSSLIDEDGIQSISMNDIGAAILSVSVAGAEMLGIGEGVYIGFVSNAIFISKITFAETIHPIDPKFIPGVVEIDLNAYGIDPVAIVMSEAKETRIVGTKAMWEEINKNKNVVFKCILDDRTIIMHPIILGHKNGLITNI